LLEELFKTHNKLVMVGGSGMYIDALCNGLDDFPQADQELRFNLMERLEHEGLESMRAQLKLIDRESYDGIDIANPHRVIRAIEVTLQTGRKFSDWKSSPKKARPFEIKKIGLNRNREDLYERINRRVDVMIETGLLQEVQSLAAYRNMPALNTVGYKELFNYLDGTISLEIAVDLIKRNSRRYAKRQLTYWGRDKNIEWLSCPAQIKI
ncbi:MAG: tRNA (adenosine(37)-N6)-dimethylallyltransferase MiaA, partial [Bacteroidales bacterium]